MRKSGWFAALSMGMLFVGSLTWAGGPVGPGPTILKPVPTPTIPGIRPTIPPIRVPDLRVTLATTGRATVVGDHVEVPVRVVVKNWGTGEAPKFKVEVENASTGGPYWFTVPGQTDRYYAWTNAPLAAGDSVTFAGKVTFGPTDRHKTVSIRAVADSCSEEDLMPRHCRVQESNEGNNTSSSMPVALP